MLCGSGISAPGPGIEPASPALQGGFLTTGPPGKTPRSKLINANVQGGVGVEGEKYEEEEEKRTKAAAAKR